jgi:hypothetical protein
VKIATRLDMKAFATVIPKLADEELQALRVKLAELEQPKPDQAEQKEA